MREFVACIWKDKNTPPITEFGEWVVGKRCKTREEAQKFIQENVPEKLRLSDSCIADYEYADEVKP